MKPVHLRPATHPKRRRGEQPKLCPTCLNVMTPVGADEWECPKHGKPAKP